MSLETYIHKIEKSFKMLPEVYQIEVCSACNLKCPMCLKTTDVERPDGLLDMKLLELMHSRGDFAGSYYVELQMSGEPTLHPQLDRIIRFLKYDVGVLVGLSTHGLLMKKKNLAETLSLLDALTISVDSTNPELYTKMRYPAKFENLVENIDYLMDYFKRHTSASFAPLPFTELQLIETKMFEGSGDVPALEALARGKDWLDFCSIRTTADCFSEMQGRFPAGTWPRNTPICMNPFGSVSVTQDGKVVSCCYIFDAKESEVTYYGNLYEQPLSEIWGNERVKAMQQMHLSGCLKDSCTRCYLKSPMQIHMNITSRLIRNRRGR